MSSKNLVLLLSALLLNCQEPDSSVPRAAKSPETPHFISASPGDPVSKATLQMFAAGLGQAELAALLKYDVETYVVKYRTSFKGEPVEASGMVMIPSGMAKAAPIVSLQHGTLFHKDEAPSVKGGFQGVEFLASAGYIAVLPDYLGYGASDSLFHPYYDRLHSAYTVIDLILATKQFLLTKEAALSEDVFLAGYSEGGYVTLAAAKEIEFHPEYGLQVKGVAAGAGGYDLSHMLLSITSQSHYAYPSYLAYVLMSYNRTYEWNRPLTDFFKPAYAEVLERYMDGEHGGSYINAKLTTNVRNLFNSAFYQALRDPAQEKILKAALASNSVSGWKTDIPIRLYHGTTDLIIPYENSEVTLQNFKSQGSKDVSLQLFQGKGHSNGFEPMLRDFIPWFLSL